MPTDPLGLRVLRREQRPRSRATRPPRPSSGSGSRPRGIRLVFGGGRRGLMGVVADAALAAGGRVVGVIPRGLVDRELAHTGLSELRIVDTLHERKAADGRAGRRVHRAARRARHARGARRGPVVGPARPPREADRAARRRTATSRRSRPSSTTPLPRGSSPSATAGCSSATTTSTGCSSGSRRGRRRKPASRCPAADRRSC